MILTYDEHGDLFDQQNPDETTQKHFEISHRFLISQELYHPE